MTPYLLILAYTVLSAFWNNRRIKESKKGHITHWTEDLFLQGIFMAVVAFIFGDSWLNMAVLFLAMTALYWIVFDPFLNYLRNRYLKPKRNIWCYLSYGNYVDRFLLLFPCWLRHVIKVTVFGAFVYLSFKA